MSSLEPELFDALPGLFEALEDRFGLARPVSWDLEALAAAAEERPGSLMFTLVFLSRVSANSLYDATNRPERGMDGSILFE